MIFIVAASARSQKYFQSYGKRFADSLPSVSPHLGKTFHFRYLFALTTQSTTTGTQVSCRRGYWCSERNGWATAKELSGWQELGTCLDSTSHISKSSGSPSSITNAMRDLRGTSGSDLPWSLKFRKNKYCGGGEGRVQLMLQMLSEYKSFTLIPGYVTLRHSWTGKAHSQLHRARRAWRNLSDEDKPSGYNPNCHPGSISAHNSYRTRPPCLPMGSQTSHQPKQKCSRGNRHHWDKPLPQHTPSNPMTHKPHTKHMAMDNLFFID